jgi:hypothetical protein
MYDAGFAVKPRRPAKLGARVNPPSTAAADGIKLRASQIG